MTKLGISIYPEVLGEEPTIKYLDMAAKNNFKTVFANLLEIKNDEEGRARLEMFKRVFHHARKLGMDMMIDVNPYVYEQFNLPPTELQFFKDLGANIVRLDTDFGGEVEAKLSNNDLGMKIVLNPSMTTDTFLNAIKFGADPKKFVANHNFYPMRYTGLEYETFLTNSMVYKTHGTPVSAWITLPPENNGVGPWNVNEGMVTLEEHRDLSLKDQVLWFLKLGFMDEILISQQPATEAQLVELGQLIKSVEEFKKDKVKELKLDVMTEDQTEIDILNFSRHLEMHGMKAVNHVARPDVTSYFVRAWMTRHTFEDATIKPHNEGKLLKRGDVVILNDGFKRYKGEVHIITREIDDSKDKLRNLVGRISEEDMHKIDFIGGLNEFKFNF